MEEENPRLKIFIAIVLFGYLFYRIYRFFYLLFFGTYSEKELHAWLLIAGYDNLIGFFHLVTCGIFGYCFF
ncbi:MAG: hypothetical protein SFU98_10515 [Leptospiraceae bacterium]|nr:hypothetical protein [Leptospiraceae bacterium]